MTCSAVRAGQRAETPRPAPRGRGTETRGRPRASWSVWQLGDRRAKGQVWPPGREVWTGADPPWGACGGHAGDGTTCCTAFPSRAETSGLLDSLEHSEHGGSPPTTTRPPGGDRNASGEFPGQLQAQKAVKAADAARAACGSQWRWEALAVGAWLRPGALSTGRRGPRSGRMRQNSPRCGRVCCIRLVVTVRSGSCSIACVLRSQTSARPKRPVTGAISGSSITSKKKSPPNATGSPRGPPRPEAGSAWGPLQVAAACNCPEQVAKSHLY